MNVYRINDNLYSVYTSSVAHIVSLLLSDFNNITEVSDSNDKCDLRQPQNKVNIAGIGNRGVAGPTPVGGADDSLHLGSSTRLRVVQRGEYGES